MNRKITKAVGGLGDTSTGIIGEVLAKTGPLATDYDWIPLGVSAISIVNGASSVSIPIPGRDIIHNAGSGYVHRLQVNGVDVLIQDSQYTAVSTRLGVENGEQSTPMMLARATNLSYDGQVHSITSNKVASSDFDLILAKTNTVDDTFRLRGDGRLSTSYAGGLVTGGADYAEMFEWEDGNASDEDRAGVSVVLVGDKIREAKSGETPIGVVSFTASVIGDGNDLEWNDKYLTDDFGRVVYEETLVVTWEERTEEGLEIRECYSNLIPREVTVPPTAKRRIVKVPALNPKYDPAMEYIPRDDRKEYSVIGLLGKVRIKKGQVIRKTWKKYKDISDLVTMYYIKP